MARKPKKPVEKPSKAYLVSFGDTMTALLAFFIVLNSFAKEQTGANMHSGTGSFMNSSTSIGLPGGVIGDRTRMMVPKEKPSPIYAVESNKPKSTMQDRLGPDDEPDQKRIIDRQTENFKRFLTNIARDFKVDETPPTRSQIVFDSFEKFEKSEEFGTSINQKSIRLISEAILKLGRDDFKLEIVVWANMPSKRSLVVASGKAISIRKQVLKLFRLSERQKKRFTVSAKPWLFSDAARPKVSFVVSKLDLAVE